MSNLERARHNLLVDASKKTDEEVARMTREMHLNVVGTTIRARVQAALCLPAQTLHWYVRMAGQRYGFWTKNVEAMEKKHGKQKEI